LRLRFIEINIIGHDNGIGISLYPGRHRRLLGDNRFLVG